MLFDSATSAALHMLESTGWCLLLHSQHFSRLLVVNLMSFSHDLILSHVGPSSHTILFELQLLQIGLVSSNVLKGSLCSQLTDMFDWKLLGCDVAGSVDTFGMSRFHKLPGMKYLWMREVMWPFNPCSTFWNTWASCGWLSHSRGRARTACRWPMHCNCCCTQRCCHFRCCISLSGWIRGLHWLRLRLSCWWRWWLDAMWIPSKIWSTLLIFSQSAFSLFPVRCRNSAVDQG